MVEHTRHRIPATTEEQITRIGAETDMRRALEQIITLATMPVQETGTPTEFSRTDGQPITETYKWITDEELYGTSTPLDKYYDHRDTLTKRLVSPSIADQILSTISNNAIRLQEQSYALLIEQHKVSTSGDRWSQSYTDFPHLKIYRLNEL